MICDTDILLLECNKSNPRSDKRWLLTNEDVPPVNNCEYI